MKKVTVTKAYIDSLKSKIERLEKDNKEITDDRALFRDFFVALLKDNVSMNSKNQYYSSEQMIRKLSKLMNDVKTWWWA